MKSLSTYNFKIQIRRSDGRSKPYKPDPKLRVALPDEFYYVGKGRNGKNLFTSETEKRKATLLKTINHLFPNIVIVDKS